MDFDSSVQLNRVVSSTDLADAGADLKIVARFTDRIGEAPVAALRGVGAEDFAFG